MTGTRWLRTATNLFWKLPVEFKHRAREIKRAGDQDDFTRRIDGQAGKRCRDIWRLSRAGAEGDAIMVVVAGDRDDGHRSKAGGERRKDRLGMLVCEHAGDKMDTARLGLEMTRKLYAGIGIVGAIEP